MKMKIVPMSEKQEATLSVVSSALDSAAVNEGMMGQGAARMLKSVECSYSPKDTTYIRGQ